MPTFGENLRNLRLSRGYSQDKFAKAINSNQPNVTAWERGTRMPNLATIKHIADTFKVPLSSLISIESTGLNDDYVKEIADVLQNNAKVRQLFDKAKYMKEEDLDAVLTIVNALVRNNEQG